MRKNERLIGIRPYQTSSGEWHLELTYAYEDEKGEHNVIFPDVQCPFPTLAVPFPDTTPHAIGIYIRSCGYTIPGLDEIPLDIGYCRLAQERGNTEISFLRACIVHYIEETAETCYTASYERGNIFIRRDIYAHRIGSCGIFTHGAQMQTDSCSVQHIRCDDSDGYRKKYHYTAVFESCAFCKRKTEIFYRIEISRFRFGSHYGYLGHDEFHCADTESSKRKTRNILICMERNGKEAVDKPHHCGAEKRCEQCYDNDKHAGQSRIYGHELERKATAGGTDAHYAGDTKIQMTCLFRDDFACGAVKKCHTERDSAEKIIYKLIHYCSPPFLRERKFTL